jgi:hypothetical protein
VVALKGGHKTRPYKSPLSPLYERGEQITALEPAWDVVNPPARGMNRIGRGSLTRRTSDTRAIFGATDVARASRDSSVPD